MSKAMCVWKKIWIISPKGEWKVFPFSLEPWVQQTSSPVQNHPVAWSSGFYDSPMNSEPPTPTHLHSLHAESQGQDWVRKQIVQLYHEEDKK